MFLVVLCRIQLQLSCEFLMASDMSAVSKAIGGEQKIGISLQISRAYFSSNFLF